MSGGTSSRRLWASIALAGLMFAAAACSAPTMQEAPASSEDVMTEDAGPDGGGDYEPDVRADEPTAPMPPPPAIDTPEAPVESDSDMTDLFGDIKGDMSGSSSGSGSGGLSTTGDAAGPRAPGNSAEPPDRGVALPDDFEIVSNVLMPTESYLPRGDGMPTGVVLLDKREGDRNARLCDALLGRRTATVRTEAVARAENPEGDFLVTHWLSRGRVFDEQDCSELLAKYDFERARTIKATYALRDTRGPVFLALDSTGEIVFLDLNDATPDQVYKATSDWMALALAAPQEGPNAGKPPKAEGIAANANALFAKLAGGFASLVGSADPAVVRFNDPVSGTAREFRIYRAGVYLIGATFVL